MEELQLQPALVPPVSLVANRKPDRQVLLETESDAEGNDSLEVTMYKLFVGKNHNLLQSVASNTFTLLCTVTNIPQLEMLTKI